jgi:hypothetical protein
MVPLDSGESAYTVHHSGGPGVPIIEAVSRYLSWAHLYGGQPSAEQRRANIALIVALRNALPTILKALDEHDVLVARVEELEKGLKPFADVDAHQEDCARRMGFKDGNAAVKVPRADVRRARALLKGPVT